MARSKHSRPGMLDNLSLRWKLLLTGLLCALLTGLSGTAGMVSLHWIQTTMVDTTGEISRSIGIHNEKIRLISQFRKIISSIQRVEKIEEFNAILSELNAFVASEKSLAQEDPEPFDFLSEAALDLLLQQQNLLVSQVDINEKWVANEAALEQISNLTLTIIDDIEFASFLQAGRITLNPTSAASHGATPQDIPAFTPNAANYQDTATIVHLNISRITNLMNEMRRMRDIDLLRYRNSEIQTLLNGTKAAINTLPASDKTWDVSKLLAAFKSTSDEVTVAQIQILMLESEYRKSVRRIYRQIEAMEPNIVQATEIMKEHAEQALSKSSRLVMKLQNLVLFFVVLAFILAVMIAVAIRRSVLKQLCALNAGIEIVGRGNLSYTVDTGTGDELGILSRAFDHMAASIQQSQKKLGEALVEAKNANQAKSMFLSNMTHEIRTPLNAILGFSQILQKDQNLTAPQREKLNTISTSGEHLLAIINDILEISKIEAGRTTYNIAPFELRPLFKDLEMMFTIRTDAKKLQLIMDIAEDLPEFVLGDEGKLRQTYINLLGNAVKFTSSGSITVKVVTERTHKGKVRLTSDVRDTGVGIAPEEMGRLFRYFEQTSSGMRSGSGTGLGLAISKQFVTMMGGDITVTSEVDNGSCFSFSIELVEVEAGVVEQTKKHMQVIGIRHPGDTPYRALVADDVESNRQILTFLLKSVGFAIEEAANGVEAVEKYRSWSPHLILMDMRMPVMNGFEAVRRIRAMEAGSARKTPIVAVTASAMDYDRKEIMATGTDGYVGKPFRENELFNVIRSVMDIDFIYKEEVPAQEGHMQAEMAAQAVLTPDAIAALPGDLVRRLRSAVISADLDALFEQCDEIESRDGNLAAAVRRLAQGYEYEDLLKVLGPER